MGIKIDGAKVRKTLRAFDGSPVRFLDTKKIMIKGHSIRRSNVIA